MEEEEEEEQEEEEADEDEERGQIGQCQIISSRSPAAAVAAPWCRQGFSLLCPAANSLL